MKEALSSAIHGRKVVEFTYQGKQRIGDPHKLGLQDGSIKVELYQTGGQSSQPNSLPQWRCFDVAKIVNLTVTDRLFTPRHDYNPDRERWDSSVAQI